MLWGKIIFVLAGIAMTGIRYPHQKRNKSNTIVRNQKDRQERVLLALVGIGMWLIPLVYIVSPWLAFADYTLPTWTLGVGTLVMAAGLWLFWRAHADLGRNWSPSLELHREQTLVTQGVYQRVRHPMYSAIWLIALAQPLLLHNWLAGFGSLVTFGLLYWLRVPAEERMMLQQFGRQYQRYIAMTGRVIPKLSR